MTHMGMNKGVVLQRFRRINFRNKHKKLENRKKISTSKITWYTVDYCSFAQKYVLSLPVKFIKLL